MGDREQAPAVEALVSLLFAVMALLTQLSTRAGVVLVSVSIVMHANYPYKAAPVKGKAE